MKSPLKLSLFALGIFTAVLRADERPNILYIMADDHSTQAIGCYGGNLAAVARTPNIDRLAGEGMRLTNCLVTNSLCSPSRAAILTGQYAHRNGVLVLSQPLKRGQVTLATMLQDAGYQTALVGKWHLVNDPTGFDYWCVLPGQGKYHNPDFTENGVKRHFDGYATDIIGDLSLEWLKNRKPGQPFFLMCHHKAPHGLWEYAERHKTLYEGVTIPEPATLHDDYAQRAPGGISELDSKIYSPQAQRSLSTRMQGSWPTGRLDLAGQSTPEQIRRATFQKYAKDYLRCVAAVDENVGRLLRYLDESGLAKNTVVIYTSDQGMFVGEHNFYDKRLILEESLRMPFIVRYPPTIKPGTTDAHLVRNVDFAETMLDFAGLKPDPGMQGRSFKGILEGRIPADWTRAVFYAYYAGRPVHYGLRTARHKLAIYGDGTSRDLFDLQSDPHELRSVYQDPAYAGVRRELEEEVQRQITALDVRPEDLPFNYRGKGGGEAKEGKSRKARRARKEE